MNSFPDIITIVLATLWIAPVGLMLLLAGAGSWLRSPLKLAHCWRLGQVLLLWSLAASMLLGIWFVFRSLAPHSAGLMEAARPMGIYLDGLSVWTATMVSFIAWVILRFADTYLRGDPGRHRFLPWFLIIISSVLILISTNHLLVLASAWVVVSLALHPLLTLYQDRSQARVAAAQKFILSRVGDLLVFFGVFLLYAHHDTFVLQTIIAQTTAGAGAGIYPALASITLALAAVIKCAQIPFHGWLLRVMEAPTPVSALLHAGVINLGGFLWLRLFPVFDGYTPGHLILLAIGGMTAVVAVITMMTQYSVKHALAWSTCAQMGFMLFEIGMGAYTLALLHLLAHSLYKAHSFLASGRTVAASVNISFPSAPWAERFSRAGVSAGLAALILSLAPQIVQYNPILGATLALAVGAAAFGIPGCATRTRSVLLCSLAVAVVPCYFLLHWLISPALANHGPIELPVTGQLIGWLVVVTLVAGTLVTQLSPQHRLVRTLCTHFRHGLYMEAPIDHATRVLAARILRFPSLLRRVPHHPFRMENPS
ncbi:NADH-quinone oxidoreductase subunit L [uncultured Marinobacter sp.]|uniref:NADH-quinone oxidoreductase subunit L n=1 Tax=uncultured Marinobacter sp. TaxID=187379 RepID=UPI0030D784ED